MLFFYINDYSFIVSLGFSAIVFNCSVLFVLATPMRLTFVHYTITYLLACLLRIEWEHG